MPDESVVSQDKSLSARNVEENIYRYPTPVHDTLAGFDWIQDSLKPAQLGVFGSHIGGSLALMLALTEAQSVQAIAAIEPVCDWPGLDEYCAIESVGTQVDPYSSHGQDQVSTNQTPNRGTKGRPPQKRSPADLIPLLAAREQFFSSPERCFDAFASPILFLRSAGRDVPGTFPKYLTGSEYPVPTVKGPRKTTSAEQNSAPDGSLWDRDIYPDLDAESDSPETSAQPTRRRKALSRWPPHGLDYGLSGKVWSGPGHGIDRLQVTLPWVRIFLSRGDLPAGLVDLNSSHSVTKRKDRGNGPTVLARQGEEMVSVMRRACFWGREKGFGERRVTLSRVGGDGDASADGGIWLRSVFEGSIEGD